VLPSRISFRHFSTRADQEVGARDKMGDAEKATLRSSGQAGDRRHTERF
jgi:hypothetical protein